MTQDKEQTKENQEFERPVKSSLMRSRSFGTTDHSASPIRGDEPKVEWQKLCVADDTIIDGLYPYRIERSDGVNIEILLARVNGKLFALNDHCPHRGVPFSGSAFIDGEILYCGYHHWGFELSSGAHTLPTGISVPRYDVKEADGMVWISIR